MTKYLIEIQTTATATMQIEAEDADSAIDQAFEGAPNVCAQCGGWGKDYDLELGEWDMPRDGEGREASWAITEANS